MKTIATYLPIFNGFYNTIFEFDESNFCYENDVNFDRLTIDYKQYEIDVVKECIEFVKENCILIKSIEFENICSPKEYNFRNDSANITIQMDLKAFKKYLYNNKESLNEYLKERYTSCSGFISHYGNSFKEWEQETENFNNLEGHYLGSLLDFYFLVEGITVEDMYCYVCASIYLDSYITIDELEFKELAQVEKINALKLAVENNEIDLTFGYNAILVEECKNKVQMFGGNLYNYLI